MSANPENITPITDDDAELAQRFEAGTIPHDQWDHPAHLRLAHYYLSQYSYAAALERLRGSLKSYLAAQGITDTATRGYHETMTQLWLRVIAALMAGHAGERTKTQTADASGESAEFLEQHPFLLNKSLWRLFYSRRRMVSMRAKAEFLPPDITPLPEIDESQFPYRSQRSAQVTGAKKPAASDRSNSRGSSA